jgi:hypothetical protein
MEPAALISSTPRTSDDDESLDPASEPLVASLRASWTFWLDPQPASTDEAARRMLPDKKKRRSKLIFPKDLCIILPSLHV